MALRDDLKGAGRIQATARIPEIDAYVRKKNKGSRPLVPTEILIMRQEVDAQIRVIKQNWPVATGTSRAGWSYTLSGSPGKVSIIYNNPVWYSAWIVVKGSGKSVAAGGKPWFMTLLPTVYNANKARLLRRLKEQIDKTQEEIEYLMEEEGLTRRRAETRAGQNVRGLAQTRKTRRTSAERIARSKRLRRVRTMYEKGAEQ